MHYNSIKLNITITLPHQNHPFLSSQFLLQGYGPALTLSRNTTFLNARTSSTLLTPHEDITNIGRFNHSAKSVSGLWLPHVYVDQG